MITVRRFCQEDLSEVVKIINANYRNSYEEIPFTIDSLFKYISDRNPTILVAVDSCRIVGAIFYLVWPWGNSIEMLAAVQIPENQLIEDQLVEGIELTSGVDQIYASVEEKDSQIQRWKQRGYYAKGGVCQLTTELSCLREIPPTRCVTKIRSLQSGEVVDLISLMNKSFGFARLGLDEVRSWWRIPGFSEEWIHVAEVDGRIVSAVVSMLDREYSEHYCKKRGYLGPAATLPDYRGMGLAPALTVTALNFLLRKGMESAAMYIFDENKSSLDVALKVGFRISKHWVNMKKKLKPRSVEKTNCPTK